ncbi:MAG: polyprenyl synthetase family protein [Terriglobales bacterium]
MPLPAQPAGVPAAEAMAPFALIQEPLEAVERQFTAELATATPGIAAIAEYLHSGGGKRLRPALLLLAAEFSGARGPQIIALATVVEMIHAATLIHDDVIDDAATRRGRPSANARWGARACVLAGDWLYMQAFSIALRQRHFGILEELIQLTEAMVEGELQQQEMAGTVVTRTQHLDLIEAKTARLFAVCCKLGALAVGREAEATVLECFGRELGLAFQMVDDVLDFTASEDWLGKPVGNDLREGKMTLPALYAYEQATATERERIQMVMREGYATVGLAEIRELLGRSGALERALAEARVHAAAARDLLAAYPPSPWRDALLALPALAVERTR